MNFSKSSLRTCYKNKSHIFVKKKTQFLKITRNIKDINPQLSMLIDKFKKMLISITAWKEHLRTTLSLLFSLWKQDILQSISNSH
jgi:hypothetical protein